MDEVASSEEVNMVVVVGVGVANDAIVPNSTSQFLAIRGRLGDACLRMFADCGGNSVCVKGGSCV